MLGAGNQATVYQVRGPNERAYALKIWDADLTLEELARHHVEWSALAAVRHRNVLEFISASSTPDWRPYILTELLHGETLAQRLDRVGSLSVAEGIRIASEICAGLEAVHAVGIIHRDLKPENIWITTRGRVKLIDFGLARAKSHRITRHGIVVGTPRYMAPEQALAEPVDARADLYCVGLLLYEMLAGAPPFAGQDSGAWMRAHVVEPPSLDRLSRQARALKPLLSALLAKEPDDRPPSASAVLRELCRAMPRRRRARAALLVAAAVAAVTVLVWPVGEGDFAASPAPPSAQPAR